MDNNQSTSDTRINISNYLVTQAVDTKSLAQDKLLSDLEQLSKAEEKSTYKADIAKNIRNPQVKRAVSALILANPLKGY
jgi:hypothetical protein